MIRRRLFTLGFYIILFSSIIILYERKISIPYIPLSSHRVVKIEFQGNTTRIATEDEKKKILTLLNSKNHYDKIITKSRYSPHRRSQIKIFLRNGTIFQITRYSKYSIMINGKYIVNQPEIRKILDGLSK